MPKYLNQDGSEPKEVKLYKRWYLIPKEIKSSKTDSVLVSSIVADYMFKLEEEIKSLNAKLKS